MTAMCRELESVAPLFAPRTISAAELETACEAAWDANSWRPINEAWSDKTEDGREPTRKCMRAAFAEIGFTVTT